MNNLYKRATACCQKQRNSRRLWINYPRWGTMAENRSGSGYLYPGFHRIWSKNKRAVVLQPFLLFLHSNITT